MMLFLLGSVRAIYEETHERLEGTGAPGFPVAHTIVLSPSLRIEGFLAVAIREFNEFRGAASA